MMNKPCNKTINTLKLRHYERRSIKEQRKTVWHQGPAKHWPDFLFRGIKIGSTYNRRNKQKIERTCKKIWNASSASRLPLDNALASYYIGGE